MRRKIITVESTEEGNLAMIAQILELVDGEADPEESEKLAWHTRKGLLFSK